jgi:hypothetical protein
MKRLVRVRLMLEGSKTTPVWRSLREESTSPRILVLEQRLKMALAILEKDAVSYLVDVTIMTGSELPGKATSPD